jgi:hypothetical protein
MGEKYSREQYEADLAARQEREAREEQGRRERTEKESARRVWLADGGREADFEKEWPRLRNQARRQRVIDADQKAREAHRAAGISQI